MKKLILILMVGSFFMGCMPPKLAVPLTKEQMSHQIIFNTDKSKDEVFDVSLEWMAKTFVSSKAVIEHKDKPSGKIIGKGYITMITQVPGMSVPIEYHFTLSIEVKEDRYRLYFENFRDEMYSDSLEGTVPRKKIRVRNYPNSENSSMYLEMKILLVILPSVYLASSTPVSVQIINPIAFFSCSCCLFAIK